MESDADRNQGPGPNLKAGINEKKPYLPQSSHVSLATQVLLKAT